MELGAALFDQDIARSNELTAVSLHTKELGL
jgi:hypothetical protein